MNPGRRLGAARHGLALLVVTQLLPTVAWADGELQLLLPLVSAMAFGVSAVEASRDATPVRSSRFTPRVISAKAPPGRRLSFLPQRLVIPDGYEIDFDRDPPRFAAPVDRDRIVAFDLVSRPRHGWTASIAYDEEKRGPFPGSGEVIRLMTEFRF